MHILSSASLLSWVLVVFTILPITFGSPIPPKRASNIQLGLNADFPDPSIVKALDGNWYAFGTAGNGKRIQVAVSSDFNSWNLLDVDALPTFGTWETGNTNYAPDVIQRKDRKFVMYYAGEAKSDLRHHCVNTAISDLPAGPYIPSNTPLACPLDNGGAIDPAGFLDKDGARYVVYKVDGNSIGHGGTNKVECNNSIEPLVATPLMLQKVKEDGVTPIGEPVKILDRNTADGDGPLVEAPSLVFHEGTYFLFYSTHCFTDTAYDVRYATSSSITGPYTKNNLEFVQTGDSGLNSPGGATVCGCGDKMVLHGWCNNGSERCMYHAKLKLSGKTATLV